RMKQCSHRTHLESTVENCVLDLVARKPAHLAEWPGPMLEGGLMEKSSVYIDGEQEAMRFKWIESEKAGKDLGEAAIRAWVKQHWWGFLRARWVEHLQGRRFWVELDRGDFGLLQREFHDTTLLLDRILDRLKTGKENLDIILWAQDFGICMDSVL